MWTDQLHKTVRVYSSNIFAVLGGMLLFNLAIFPITSEAQSVRYISPSIALGGVYDDNIFYSSADKVDDLILRLSPELWGVYETERTEVHGLYSFDSEFYAENSDLNDALIRQRALGDWLYHMNEKLDVGLNVSYDETEYPGELNTTTDFNLGRTNARRFSIGPSLDYILNPKTRMGLDYSFTRDRVTGATGGDTHLSGIEIAREISRSDSAYLRYRWYVYDFESGEDSDAHVPMLGWEHKFNNRTSFNLAAGPRFGDGTTRPEIAFVATHLLDNGEVELTYDHNESIILGESGTVRTQRIGAEITHDFNRDLNLEIAPSYTSGKQDDASFDVFQLDLELNYRINDSFSATGSYQYSVQDGNLDLARDDDKVKRNTFYIGVVYTFPSWGDSSRNIRRREI